MHDKFEPIIYQQEDPNNSERSVWVRITTFEGIVTVATFREKPDAETQVRQSITSFDFDPCCDDQSKIVSWNEHADPDNEDGREVLLVESIDNWQPREPSETVEDRLNARLQALTREMSHVARRRNP